jgi:large subunit ribosomal protein L13
LEKHPERAIMFAVRGMLSKNKLRDKRMKRLKVFADTSNKFDYLHPEKIEING